MEWVLKGSLVRQGGRLLLPLLLPVWTNLANTSPALHSVDPQLSLKGASRTQGDVVKRGEGGGVKDRVRGEQHDTQQRVVLWERARG